MEQETRSFVSSIKEKGKNTSKECLHNWLSLRAKGVKSWDEAN